MGGTWGRTGGECVLASGGRGGGRVETARRERIREGLVSIAKHENHVERLMGKMARKVHRQGGKEGEPQ